MMGGGTGPAAGTSATTCTPGPFHIMRMLQAAEAFPMNIGFLGKGNASLPDALIEQVAAGVCGLKLHEDWGTTPAAIDNRSEDHPSELQSLMRHSYAVFCLHKQKLKNTTP